MNKTFIAVFKITSFVMLFKEICPFTLVPFLFKKFTRRSLKAVTGSAL
jgi:hypothetical protein